MGDLGDRSRDGGLRLTLGWVAEAVGGLIRSGDRGGEIGNIVTDTCRQPTCASFCIVGI